MCPVSTDVNDFGRYEIVMVGRLGVWTDRRQGGHDNDYEEEGAGCWGSLW